jgi:hypothetical protein
MMANTDSRNRAAMKHLRCLLVVFVLAIGAHAHAGNLTPLEARRIEYLITAIESLPNAQFIRNGTAYDAKDAAGHLRLKLQTAGSRVATAEDFIRLCASVSSVSGLPYQIKFADGHTITSEAFLRQRLAEFEPTSN